MCYLGVVGVFDGRAVLAGDHTSAVMSLQDKQDTFQQVKPSLMLLMSTDNQLPFFLVVKQEVTYGDTFCCYTGSERKKDDGLISNP